MNRNDIEYQARLRTYKKAQAVLVWKMIGWSLVGLAAILGGIWCGIQIVKDIQAW